MLYIEWASRVLTVLVELTRPGGYVPMGAIARGLGLPRQAADIAQAPVEGTPGHALVTALEHLADVEFVMFPNFDQGAGATPAGRDAADRGMRQVWAEWWDESHLRPEPLRLLRAVAASAERPEATWADVTWVEAGDVWRPDGTPLEPMDLDEWERLRDAVQDLNGKRLVQARMFGRDTLAVRPMLKGMVRALEDHPLSSQRRAGVLDWAGTAAGWGAEEQRLQGLIQELATAADADGFMDVGRRARELYDDVAAKVFRPEMVPDGTDAPGRRDGSAMLEMYTRSRFGGERHEAMRAFLRGLDRLANHLTHSESADRLTAFGTVQAMVLLVRFLQAADRPD
jgi:hypothetical protein